MQVYLALGTNLGDRMRNLRAAIQQLASHVTLTRISPIYETEPWGVADQADFLNLVVEGKTELAPTELLLALQAIEQRMGRQRTVRYGPRVIDLDILLYDDVVLQTEQLEIPHARMAERRFVLVPLNDIAPDVWHPRLKRTAQQLLRDLTDHTRIELFPQRLTLTDVTSNN
jgi:2-amino-4-hydroxy-6-hydroxymethyldihydropteridine diphosphokinase